MTTEERLERMEQDLDRTRRALRRTRLWLGLGALAGLGALCLAASRPQPRVVSANEFVVLDRDGHVVARLGNGQAGGGIEFFDRAGHPRLLVQEGAQGPSLRLLGPEGRTRGAFSALADASTLTLMDPDGKVRVGLGELPKAGPNLSLFDAKGRPVWVTRVQVPKSRR